VIGRGSHGYVALYRFVASIDAVFVRRPAANVTRVSVLVKLCLGSNFAGP